MRQPHLGAPVDMWSLGVCVFVLVTAAVPFPANNMRELRKRVLQLDTKPLRFPNTGTRPLSDGAKAFINALLRFEPDHRLTPTTALRHFWLGCC